MPTRETTPTRGPGTRDGETKHTARSTPRRGTAQRRTRSSTSNRRHLATRARQAQRRRSKRPLGRGSPMLSRGSASYPSAARPHGSATTERRHRTADGATGAAEDRALRERTRASHAPRRKRRRTVRKRCPMGNHHVLPQSRAHPTLASREASPGAQTVRPEGPANSRGAALTLVAEAPPASCARRGRHVKGQAALRRRASEQARRGAKPPEGRRRPTS